MAALAAVDEALPANGVLIFSSAMNHALTTPLVAALALAMALSACASNDPKRITDAATAPLNDLNLVNAAIPPVLIDAQKRPYSTSAEAGCAALASEVRGLDEVLGPDLDAPATESNPGLIARGTTAVGNAAVGALRGAAEGLVPYRSWVRKLSGAERYSRDVAAAIAAGTVRRAFLKGVSVTRGCTLAAVATAAAAASAPR